jgi:hypothetical protein
MSKKSTGEHRNNRRRRFITSLLALEKVNPEAAGDLLSFVRNREVH